MLKNLPEQNSFPIVYLWLLLKRKTQEPRNRIHEVSITCLYIGATVIKREGGVSIINSYPLLKEMLPTNILRVSRHI